MDFETLQTLGHEEFAGNGAVFELLDASKLVFPAVYKKLRVSTLRRSSVERNWLRPQIGRMITSPWCTAFRKELLRL